MGRFRHLPSYHYEDNTDGMLKKSIGKPLRNYKIYGNSVQDETKLADLQLESGSLSNALGLTYEEQIIADKTRIRMTSSFKIEKNRNYKIKSELTNSLGFRLYDESGLCTYASSVAITNGYYLFSSGSNTAMAFTVVGLNDITTKYEIYEVVSPEAPIEIESVGDKTKNLFNSEAWLELLSSKDATAYPTTTGVEDGYKYIATYPKNPNIEFMKGEFKENTRYSISFYAKLVDANKLNGTGMLITYTDGTVTRMLINSTSWKKYSVITTTNKTIDSIGLYYYHHTCGYYANIMMAEGVELLDYEPYGYRIPVKVSGKNIFDNVWENGFIDTSTGNNQSSSTYIRSANYTKVVAGANYSISSPNIGGKDEGVTVYWYFYDENKTYLKRVVSYKDRKIVPPENTKYIRLSILTLDLNAKIQIEEGEIVTEYEPYKEPVTTNIYLDEPLIKIGEYKDYIDFANQTVTRNIYKYELTGNETGWSDRGLGYDSYGIVFRNGRLLLNQPANFEYKNALCNYFPYGSIAGVKGAFSFANSATDWQFNISDGQLGISKDEDKTIRLQKWLEWLKNNYSNNIPVTMYYVAQEEKTEDIELPVIELTKGTNIIEIDTIIQPSATQYQYYKGGR